MDLYLEHHGVKGQKWGVRKKRETTNKYGVRATSGLTPEQKKRRQQYRQQQLKKQKAMLQLENSLGTRKHSEIKTKDQYLKQKMKQQQAEADLDAYLKGKKKTGQEYVNSVATNMYLKNLEYKTRYPLVNAWLGG